MNVNVYTPGHFAVKKIAVGESHSYLLKILREVRLLESLRHPNIITYHHAWLETCQFSAFGPRVPTLQFVFLSSLHSLVILRGPCLFGHLVIWTCSIGMNPLFHSTSRL